MPEPRHGRGLSGTVGGAFEDVLIQIAGKADTTQVEALDAEKVDKTSIVGTTGTSETDVMNQKGVTDELGTLAALLNDKLDAQGLDSDALATVHAVENPEYIQATTDSEDKILEGITLEGQSRLIFLLIHHQQVWNR